MKHFYSQIKKFLNIALFLGIFLQSYLSNSQTNLTTGQLLFTGFDSNFAAADGDEVSFVCLVNLSPGTTINFTDRGYSEAGVWSATNASEGTVKWVTGAGTILAGTEIILKGLQAFTYDISNSTRTLNGTVTRTDGTMANGLNLSAFGDQVVAFQGGGDIVTGAGALLIAGLHYYICPEGTTQLAWDNAACADGTNGSTLPSGLVGGTSAFFPGGTDQPSAGKFNINSGALVNNATNIRTSLMTQGNWTLSQTAINMPSGAPFLSTPTAITTDPTSKTICSGSNTTFSVVATNANSFQWQVDTGGGFINITNGAPYSGATTATLTITGATSSLNGYSYRAVVTGSGTVNSNAAILTVPTAISPSVLSQSNVSTYGGNNGAATLTVSGGTAPYFYSWSPSGGTAASASGLSAGTYTVTITDSTPNGLGGCTTTQTVTIIQPAGSVVSASTLSGFTSCGGPSPQQSFTIQAGGLTAALLISAPTGFEISTISTGPYTNNISFNPTAGNVALQTIYARLAATATGTPSGNITVSSTGILTQNVAVSGTANGVNITAQPAPATVCQGGNTSFSVTADNATGYQWQVNQGAGFNNITNDAVYSGATTNILNITAATSVFNGYTYRVVISGSCPSVNSNGVALTVNPSPSITAQPASSTICTGANTSFLVIASNATGYQWEVNSGSGFSPITNGGIYSGATTATLSITGATAGLNGYLYRAVVSGGCSPNATSSDVALTVNSAPAITANPIDSSICNNSNITFTGTATSATGYQWQINQGAGFNDIANGGVYSGATTSTLTITGATASLNNFQYRLVAIGNCTPTAVSTAATLRVSNIQSSSAQTNIACNGGNTGALSVSPNGGIGTYTYLWSNGATTSSISNLTAGNYSVTIKDAILCERTLNFTISEPPVLDGLTSTTAVSCFGGANGTATVAPSGGMPGYTYAWSPYGGTNATATGLTAGTYSVTITDAYACTKTLSVEVQSPLAALSGTTSTTAVSCFGGANGTASVIASGGTPGYTYSWSPFGGTAATATGLTAGIYSVSITDANGCPVTLNNIVVDGPAAAISASTTTTAVSCGGAANGSASVSPTGGTGTYTYLWSNGATTQAITGVTAGTYSVTISDENTCDLIINNIIIGTPSPIISNIAVTNVSCNGGANGSASVAPTGGGGVYSYLWSTGATSTSITGLPAGNYSVDITDNNTCTITENFSITQPALLTASQGIITNVSCNGGANGTATVDAIGGTGTYTYSWSPTGGNAATATGLSEGTYTVTVTDANSCETTQSFTITQPSILAVTPSQTNIFCTGEVTGSASVTVTGGTGNYTYSWSPSGGTAETATGLTAGTYTVTITDANACQITQSFTITEPAAALTASATSQTDILCFGSATGSATVTATGGTGGYTYSWAPSGGTAATASGLTAGTYVVTVTDANNCTTTQSFTITQPTNALTTTAGAINNVSCNGGANGTATVTAAGGAGSYTYSWAPSGGTAATASGLAAGTYTVTITDANLCQTTQNFTITQPDAIVTSISHTDVSCNGGANGTATVSVTGGTGTYTYFWAPFGGTAATASGLPAGTYTVTVTDANACIATESVTINQPLLLTATSAKTDISCNGANDGTATVTATGGTGTYTYTWAPSGGTAATATGLAPGTYTATITDANGCFTTQTVTIITTPDVTAPVPTVAVLPEISNYCSVSASDIAIPTAVDNCVGTINATTTDPLTYNTTGTYTINWTYDDGNGNTSTQTQTVNVLASPLDLVTFSNSQVTYDGNAHPLQVANLPTGATVTYSTNNTSINAGTYTVTATVTPSAASSNCSPVVLTADLVINKAPQLITFNAIPVKTLGINNTFNLTATASSNLPVDYTFNYLSALAPANVSTSGTVTMLRSGELTITAHQAGNANYLPAADVSQLLVILNNNIDIKRITLGTTVFENPGKTINYVMTCSENNPTVSLVNESNAIISPSANFTIPTPKPGIYNQNVTVTSEDGSLSAVYSITVQKPFGFFDIVRQKFNNVLLVNNNPATNGGYEFVAYQWFKNGQLIGTGQYYSASESLSTTLDPSADYSVKMTTKDGKVLQTCAGKITLSNSFQAKLYPNPIQPGKAITVEADFPQEELDNMQINVYSVSGQLIKTVKSSSVMTEIQLPQTTESNILMVVLETPNAKKSFKVIVK